ncbi:MAG: bactofilin family protein [bacterium]
MKERISTKLGEFFGYTSKPVESTPSARDAQEERSPQETRTQEKIQEKVMDDNNRMGDLNTIIGKGTIIEGTVKVQSSLRLDGKVTGQVLTTDSLIVGQNGEIEGEIRVKNAIIGGFVKGQIFASGKVILESRSVVNGEVKTAKLAINDGARFEGHCVMTEEAAVKALPIGSREAEDSERKNQPKLLMQSAAK